MTPVVIDLYHGDLVDGHECEGFEAAKESGILGIIHKCTQGAGMVDALYAYRRRFAEQYALLWGAYHFNTGESTLAQFNNIFAHAEPDAKTFLAIDFEDNKLSNMSITQLVDLLELCDGKLGRPTAVYGGNRLKEHMAELTADAKAFLVNRPLWLCQYGPKPVCPDGWKVPFLWQYTGDGIGPTPHKVSGFTGNAMDLNIYFGSDLAKAWAPGVQVADPSLPHGDIAPPPPKPVAPHEPWVEELLSIAHRLGW